MRENKDNYESEVKEYFSKKAQKYDDVENQIYWKLSDKLLWKLLSEELNNFKGEFFFLDAGGGTGRWAKKILENYPNAKGITVDFSMEMLDEAKKKNSFGDRWDFMLGDIQHLELKDSSFDLVLNTHNVLGFVNKKDLAVAEMSRVLKPKGRLISVIPNKDHAIFFSISLNNLEFAKSIQEKNRGKFVRNMPEIDMFSEKIVRDLYNANGLEVVSCKGFPIYIYPGYNETQLDGQTTKIKDILQESFEDVFKLECNSLTEENLASRGNNLFVLGIKI